MSTEKNPYDRAMRPNFFDGLDSPAEEIKPQPRKTPKTKSTFEPTLEQRRAVGEAQNARRGRPKKHSRRVKSKPIRVDVDEALLEKVTELQYRLGKTKHDLIEKALRLLVEMYKEET